jgi:type VI secretion system secreted protein Hcp
MPLPRFVRCVLGSAAMLVAVTAAPSASADDVFLQLDGIPGESVDAAYKDQLVINTFTLGVTVPNAGAGNVRGSAPQFDGLTVTKRVDRSSPRLLQAAATGELIKKAVLSSRKPGSRSPAYYRITLSDVLVSSVKISEGSELLESVSFTFGKIEIEYIQQDASGASKPAIRFGFDLKAGRRI